MSLQGHFTTDVEAGTIKIQVIEGSVQEIKIVGNRRLHSQYIRDRFKKMGCTSR